MWDWMCVHWGWTLTIVVVCLILIWMSKESGFDVLDGMVDVLDDISDSFDHHN